MNRAPTARSLHLYAAALVSRRPSTEATDTAASPSQARALRVVAAAVIRSAIPTAARWRSLPSAGLGFAPSSLPAGWRTLAEQAQQAARRGDVATAGEAAAALSVEVAAFGLPLAAAMLAEAAALCSPQDAARALAVATLARDRCDHGAAEWWGRRAAVLASRCGAWTVAVSAWARVAGANRERGQFREALVAGRREVRAARRARCRDRYARALHSLFSLLAEAGEYYRAERVAERALRAYPDGHPRLFAFAYDLARFDVVRARPAAALPVLAWLGGIAPTVAARLLVVASTMEAAADARDRDTLRRMIPEADAVLQVVDRGEGAAWALATLAAAVMDGAGDFTRARRWAREALALAVERGEAEPEVTARRVLEVVGI